jgi:hypothetical protein
MAGILWCLQRQARGPITGAEQPTPVSATQVSRPLAPAASRASMPATPRSPALPTHPASLRPLWGLAGETFAARRAVVRRLGTHLSEAEIADLVAFLRTTGARSGTLIGGEHYLKNEVMNLLLNQAPTPPGLGTNLCEVFRDPVQDAVTRDYAIQHLVTWEDEVASHNPNAAASPVIETLWEAAAETGTSIAGTALLGLHRLSRKNPGIDSNRVDQTCLRLAQDASAGNLSRSTALQISAQRGLRPALPAALALAEQAPTVALQVSALAAVGSLGGPSEDAFLERMQQQGSPLLQTALASARHRLHERLEQVNGPGNR